GGCAGTSTGATWRPGTWRRATWRAWKPTRSASSRGSVLAAAQIVVLHLALQHIARDAERTGGAGDVAVVQLQHGSDMLRFPGRARGPELEHAGSGPVGGWRW